MADMNENIAVPDSPEVAVVYFLRGDGPSGISLWNGSKRVHEAVFYPTGGLLALAADGSKKRVVYYNHGNNGNALAEAEAAAAEKRGKFRFVMKKGVPVSACEETFGIAKQYEKARLAWLHADRKYQREGTAHSLNEATRAQRKYADLHHDFVASARRFIDEAFGDHICWEM